MSHKAENIILLIVAILSVLAIGVSFGLYVAKSHESIYEKCQHCGGSGLVLKGETK